MITEILQLEEEEAMAKVAAAANELADKLQGGARATGFWPLVEHSWLALEFSLFFITVQVIIKYYWE